MVERADESVKEFVLASTSGFMITLHAQDKAKNVLFVTFDTIGGRLKKTGFGTEFLLKSGFDVIHVAQAEKTFYQLLSLHQFDQFVKPYAGGYKKVFTYGASLGAYAAIFYAGVIDAKAIALSPRQPIDPIVYPHYKKRYEQKMVHPLLNECVDFKSIYPPSICYDPLDKIDQKFFEERILPLYSDADLLLIENGQHSVAGTLKSSGVLKDFVVGVVETGKIPPLKVDVERNSRYTSKVALKLYKEGQYEESVRFLRMALEGEPELRTVEVFKKLCSKCVSGIMPDPGLVAARLRRQIISKFSKSVRGLNSHSDWMKAEILLYEDLLEFELAYEVASIAVQIYSGDPFFLKKLRLLKKIVSFYY